MEDKSLKPLEEVKGLTIDSDYDLSYNFYVMLIWALSVIVMFVSFDHVFKLGMGYTIFFFAVIVSFAYGSEFLIAFYFYKNKKYIDTNQSIIKLVDSVIITFGVIIILIFSKHEAYHYIYPTGVLLISLSIIITGVMMNKFYFKQAGLFSFTMSLCMFGAFLYFGENGLFHTEKYIASAVCAIPFIYIAIMTEGLKK